jgi:hypothetical protein
VNGLNAILFREDYPDYYRSRGGEIELRYTPTRTTNIALSLLGETQNSLANNENYAIFFSNDSFRVNPPIEEGNLRAIGLSAGWRSRSERSSMALHGDVDAGIKALGGDFEFVKGAIEIELEHSHASGWGNSMLTLAGAARLSGDLPAQFVPQFETRSGVLIHPQAFRTMSPHTYGGHQLAAAFFEHDFEDVPFRALGIEAPDLFAPHFSVLFNAGYSRLRSSVFSLAETSGIYSEAGIAISNIGHILRVEATVPIAQPSRTIQFTLTGQFSF